MVVLFVLNLNYYKTVTNKETNIFYNLILDNSNNETFIFFVLVIKDENNFLYNLFSSERQN
jgi:hypothetical protein